MAATHPSHPQNNAVGDGESPVAAAITVLMVPLPAQGHLNQLLHLSRLLSAAGLPVHFASTATHVRLAKLRSSNAAAGSIRFHELPIPPFANPPPDPTAACKFPDQIIPALRTAATHLRRPVHELVADLAATSRRVAVVYDSLMSSVVQDLPRIPNAESYCFRCTSAFAWYTYYWEINGRPDPPPPGAEVLREVESLDGCFSPDFLDFLISQEQVPNYCSGDIYNTSRIMEDLYINLLAKEKSTGSDKNWAIGPFNPVWEGGRNRKSDHHDVSLEWLDRQEPDSVIYVSFGTTTSLSDEQIGELAIGLEKSGQKFLWVLRDADRGNVFEGEVRQAALPDGYEERVKDRGIIVRDWAPQLEILQHVATGGFVTHCGWNSCIETVAAGVPVAAWPMHSDQQRNGVLMTKVLRVGVEVREWGRREEVVPADAVEKVVRELMASEGLRRRAAELGEAVRAGVGEGGVSSAELEAFVAHIRR